MSESLNFEVSIKPDGSFAKANGNHPIKLKSIKKVELF